MRLAVLKETAAAESRVAATPETVKKLIALGMTVAVQAGAGARASVSDADFTAAGAELAPDAAAALGGAAVVFAVQMPAAEVRAHIPRGALLVCVANAGLDPALAPGLAEAGIDVAAMELLPRITRAQAMDVLSSQANLAGYRAVIEGAGAFDRGFAMMMTAAGTVPPARVFVVGAGVAGLQAIATARRLGAIVSATDVRPAAKEEIRSLGATFVGVEDEESAGQTGAYARTMSDAFRAKQAELLTATVAKNDLVICTALVAGGKAPVIISAEMVAGMKPGSVVVDIAADAGGQLRRDRRRGADHHRERRQGAGLAQLAGPHPGRRQQPVCPQPADVPDHVLGQGSRRAEAAGGRRHRAGRHADPRRRRGARAIQAHNPGRSRRMNPNTVADEANSLVHQAQALALHARIVADQAGVVAAPIGTAVEPIVFLLAVFLLACFVGYYVVWNVTPALHSPLMGVTNAISSVIIVGAMLATGLGDSMAAKAFGFLAVTLASVNIFGGFTVVQRMLAMFRPRTPVKK